MKVRGKAWCQRVTPTKEGVDKLPERVQEGAEHGGHTAFNKRGDGARRACGGTSRQRWALAFTQVHGPREEVKSLLLPVCIALLVEVTVQ